MLSHDYVQTFAQTRNKDLNFSFLKENGELLMIAQSSGLKLEPRSLELYQELYDNVLTLCELYPPFFRFFLAIILDLEALGMVGDKGEVLSDYVIKHDLYEHETSDTRRWEIINLLARTERAPAYQFDTREALERRARGFFQYPDRFVKFNRPLFYDLTHIIFFWTDYGRKKVDATPELLKSLTNIGLLAFLDDDFDLLSEVCLCFIFLKEEAPKAWHEACEKGLKTLQIKYLDEANHLSGTPSDEYHIHIVINWLLQVSGKTAFADSIQSGLPIFQKTSGYTSTLAAISHKQHALMLQPQRSPVILQAINKPFLSPRQATIIDIAMKSTPQASEFFYKFTGGNITLH